MKKLLLFLIVSITALCFSACQVSDETVDVLLKEFQDKDIVSDNLELIDEVVKVNAGILPSTTKYYVYVSENSDLISICYKTSGQNKYDYLVTVYSSVTVDENVEYFYGDTGYLDLYYVYSDGKVSKFNKYDFENKRVYEVDELKRVLFKDKYKIHSR